MDGDPAVLQQAQEIYERIDRRDFYLDLVEIRAQDYPATVKKSDKEVLASILKFANGDDVRGGIDDGFDPEKEMCVLKKVVSSGAKVHNVS